ncbi:MAG: WD40 repeat domain-containing protein [Polyangia bacterium]
MRASVRLIAIAFSALAAADFAAADGEVLPLAAEDGQPGEAVLEALLAPGEFPKRRFSHAVEGDAALFCLDASLGSTEPFAEAHPSRVSWPAVAGLELRVVGDPLRLEPSSPAIDDTVLDSGFAVRWILEPLGQRFDPEPRFEARPVAVEVLAADDGRRLLSWRRNRPAAICRRDPSSGRPDCDLAGISREVRAVALSPDGGLVAIATGGLRPRMEVYDVAGVPSLRWQSLFPPGSGGAVEVSFSADGRWVVGLTATGRAHRFEARGGGCHLEIPSSGRAARAVPPGRLLAVGGERGELTLWHLSDGTIEWRLPPRRGRGPVDRVAASGDGSRLATLEYAERHAVIRVWETHRRRVLTEIEAAPYELADLALDGEGGRLFAAHERLGLLAVDLSRGERQLEPLGGPVGERCRGRLHWLPERGTLACASGGFVLELGRDGELLRELDAGGADAEWLVAAADAGNRFVAVGGGHLLVWKSEQPSGKGRAEGIR